MNKTLAIAAGYALIVEVWVVFVTVRYATMMMLSARLNLRYLLLMVHMTLMHTLLGKLLLIKSLHAMIFLRMHVLGLLLVSSLIFASVWWIEHGKKNADDMPQTWDAWKRVMRARFVPSYYARDLLYSN
jgi:hypothetical protein